MKKIKIQILSFTLLATQSVTSVAADLPVSQMPSPQLKATSVKQDSENLLILRDAGIGLGAGALIGLSFIAMAPGGFGAEHGQLQSDALTTGVFVGLAGGILTGLWEVKKNRRLKLSLTPGDFNTQPTSLGTTVTF